MSSFLFICSLLFCLSSTLIASEGYATDCPTALTIEVASRQKNSTDDNCTVHMYFDRLMEALQYLVEKNDSSPSEVTINLFKETDELTAGIQLTGLKDFTLVSRVATTTDIECNGNGGIHFHNCSNVVIQQVVFGNCGYVFTTSVTSSSWPSVLLFQSVQDVEIQSLIFYSSRGTALKLLDCTGRIDIDLTLFSESNVQIENGPNDYIGGGSIYILQKSASSSVSISNCMFSSNRLNGGQYTRGGGMAIVYHTAGNKLLIEKIYANGNYAMLGSFMYLAFVDEANHNLVSMRDIQVYGHKCYNSTAGSNVKNKCIGVINVQYLLNPFSVTAGFNAFLLTETMISKNVAFAGGAISLSAVRQSTDIAYTNSFNMTDFRLEFNRAQVGATFHFSDLPGPLMHSGYLLMPVLQGKIFNSFITNKSDVIIGQAAIYSNRMSILVKHPSLEFRNCMGTAMVLSEAELKILPNTAVTFSFNSGKLGGAMALLNQASVHVGENSTVEFGGNKANDKGGAIYLSNYYDNYALPMSGRQCAVRFDKNTSFHFHDNVADNSPNAIFATSVLSCEELVNSTAPPFCWDNWKYDSGSCQDLVYTSPATIVSMIDSHPVNIFPGFPFPLPIHLVDDYDQNVTSKFVVTAFVIKGDAAVDYNSQYIAGGNITIYARPDTNITLAIETSETRVVYTELVLSIQHCPPGYYSVNFSDPNRKGTDCTCGEGYRPSNVVLCNKNAGSAKIMNGWCMTYDRDLGTGIVAPWQFFSQMHHIPQDGYYTLPQTLDQLDGFFCAPLKRTGRLCGECQDGYGVPVYSYDSHCVSCPEKKWPQNTIFYLLVELVPVTLFFVLVIIFNISITSGPANAFVYFSQIMTLPTMIYTIQENINLLLDHMQSFVLSLYVLPYSIWNLDFFRTILPPFCLHPNLSTIHVVALPYISALYSLLLIVVLYTCIELHASNCRPVTYVCMPLCKCLGRMRRNWRIRTSFIDAFVTFLVLSYTKLCSVSFLLLAPNTVYSATGEVKGLRLVYLDASVKYGSSGHIWLMIIALSVVCLIVVPLPLILLLYPLQIVQRCLNVTHLNGRALKAFMDSFQGCYRIGEGQKRDMRWFSSLYFFLRIITLSVMMTAFDRVVEGLLQVIELVLVILLLVTLQPYRKSWNTLLDIFIFNVMMIVKVFLLVQSALHQLNTGFLLLGFFLIFLPLIYMSGYVGYKLFRQCRSNSDSDAARHSSIRSYNSLSSPLRDIEFPDRMLNPEEYEPLLIKEKAEFN